MAPSESKCSLGKRQAVSICEVRVFYSPKWNKAQMDSASLACKGCSASPVHGIFLSEGNPYFGNGAEKTGTLEDVASLEIRKNSCHRHDPSTSLQPSPLQGRRQRRRCEAQCFFVLDLFNVRSLSWVVQFSRGFTVVRSRPLIPIPSYVEITPNFKSPIIQSTYLEGR